MKSKPNKLYFLFFLIILLIVLVSAQAIIIINGNISAIPNAKNVPVPVFLNNNESVAGFQVEIDYPNFLLYKGIERTSRMPDATIVNNSETPGILRIAALIEGRIEAGNGKIFDIIFDVDESAVPNDYILDLSDIVVSDIETTSIPTEAVSGILTIVQSYNITFLPPISLEENFTLQDSATLPLKFSVNDDAGFVVDDTVKVRIYNEALGIDKEYNFGDGDDYIRMIDEHYIVNIHTNQLEMPLGEYAIEISFNNFQKEGINFELIQNGKGKGKKK